jgi:2-methylcitrate dehydratase PrpD
MVTKQLTYSEALEDFLKHYHLQFASSKALENLRKAYEQEKIVLTSHISTLEVTVSQLTIKVKGQQGKIKHLEKKLGVDKD